MKKKCIFLFLFLFVVCFFVSAECGDVNSDGQVDILDALICAQYYVGLNVPINLSASDVDGDGTVSIIDALQIAQYYVALIDHFEGCPDLTPTPQTTPQSDFIEDSGYDLSVGSPKDSNGGSDKTLPDPFTMWDGSQVKTKEDWRLRRRELLVEAEKKILGEKAPPPHLIGGKVSGSISSSRYTVNVNNPMGNTSFSGTVSLPSTGSAPYPAVIVVGGFNSLDSSVLASEGVAIISYDAYEISSEASGNYTTGKYFDANPDYKGKTGALVAWAWGVSRIMDMLEENPHVIDPTKIAVHGCSRFGKAAFIIGAFDQRIALGLPLEPGICGPAPFRAISYYGGQTLPSSNGEASWLGPMSLGYTSAEAVDMNDVAALYAPRGLLVMDNPLIDHLAYKANYVGMAATNEIYKAMGCEDALWYLGNTDNGNHCSTRKEYSDALRSMIRKFLKDDNSVTTGGIDIHANHRGVDVAAWISLWKIGPIGKGPEGPVEDSGYELSVGSPKDSNGGSDSTLPDPFTMWDGKQVKTKEDWRLRRRELLVEAEKKILGEKAPPPHLIGGSVTGGISETRYDVNVDNPNGSISFSNTVSLPGTGSAPYPAVIVIGGFNSLDPSVLAYEGVAVIDYDPYEISSEAAGNFTSGKYFEANPDYKGKTGALVAWAWGVSRIIDMLEKNPDIIDPTKIAIHGCSRFGKAAFVIGALDQRIALGLPLEPGTCGPAPFRAISKYGGQFIASSNGEASWLGPISPGYTSAEAVDMNDVAALYAPRGLLVMDNPHIEHLAYKANYLGMAATNEIYKAMGCEDALWYLGNSENGNHCSIRSEYSEPLRAMIRKFLKGDKSVKTGGLDIHTSHRVVDVNSWISHWNIGPIGNITKPTAIEDSGYDLLVGSPQNSNGGSDRTLPDPFTMWDGSQVETMDDWRFRRKELLVQIEKKILGQKASPPHLIGGSVRGSVSESEYTVKVDNPNGSSSFSGKISLPRSGSAPYPAVIIIGGFSSLDTSVLTSEGIATISYAVDEIASEASGDFITGKYFEANPDYRGKTGSLVAWAWGVSRIIDLLEQNPQIIDPTKIAVHGCSRYGKAAFVIGALDQRIALGLPQEPGSCGPAPLRALPVYGGQTLISCNGEASWLGPISPGYTSFEAVDMNDLVALYAPRGLLIMDNPHIEHLAYKAVYLGMAAGNIVYKAMDSEDALWYLGNSENGNHCMTRSEYSDALRAMIQKFLKGDNTVKTGGLDTHANHDVVDVSGWIGNWQIGPITE